MFSALINVQLTYSDGLSRTVVGTYGQLRHTISVRHPKKGDRPLEVHFEFPDSTREKDRDELITFYAFRMSPAADTVPTYEVLL